MSEESIKIILLGKSGVGKSHITSQIISEDFNPDTSNYPYGSLYIKNYRI